MATTVFRTPAPMAEPGTTPTDLVNVQTTKSGLLAHVYLPESPAPTVEFGIKLSTLVFVLQALSPTSTSVIRFPSVKEVKSTTLSTTSASVPTVSSSRTPGVSNPDAVMRNIGMGSSVSRSTVLPCPSTRKTNASTNPIPKTSAVTSNIGTASPAPTISTSVLMAPTGMGLHANLQVPANKATIRTRMVIAKPSLKLVYLLRHGMERNVKPTETVLQAPTTVEAVVRVTFPAKMVMCGTLSVSNAVVLKASNPTATVVSSVQEAKNGLRELDAVVCQAIST